MVVAGTVTDWNLRLSRDGTCRVAILAQVPTETFSQHFKIATMGMMLSALMESAQVLVLVMHNVLHRQQCARSIQKHTV